MHDTAMANGARFFKCYVSKIRSPFVVDVGSQDVNGSLKTVCPADARYVGLDFEPAKGVDVILKDPYELPLESNSVDVVVSSSCFEHSEMFWVLFLEIQRVLKPEGLFYLNAPSNGTFHRYPVDCWRFYPDSGLALAKWARRNGYNTTVIESYISNQNLDAWNDFVCIFVKDEAFSERYKDRIISSFRENTNALSYPELTVYRNLSEAPEDQRLGHLRRVQDKLRRKIRGIGRQYTRMFQSSR